MRIVYTGGECSSADELRDAVRRRAPELEEANALDVARSFSVEVATGSDGVTRGSVRIQEPSGANVTRRLEGRSCREVLDALAFIVAELGRAVSIEASPADATLQLAAPTESLEPMTEPAPPRTLVTPSPAPTRTDTARRLWQAGVGVEAVFTPTPSWRPAQAAYIDVSWPRPGMLLAPSARVTALRATSGAVRGAIGDAELLWVSGRMEVCPLRWGDERWWAVPCVMVEAGLLEATGSRAANTTTQRTLWLAPGLTARAALAVLDALVVEADAGALLPVIQPRFFFAEGEGQGETIHQVANVGFRFGIKLGVRF